MKGAVQAGVERQVQFSNLLIHDGPDLPRPGVRRIAGAHPSELGRKAYADGPLPGRRNPHPRPDVIAYELPAISAIRTGENVESGFEPFIEAVRDLDRLMQRVIGGAHAIDHVLGPLEGEVAVQLYHRSLGRNRLRRIDLDLIIILAPQRRHEHECKSEPQQGGAHPTGSARSSSRSSST